MILAAMRGLGMKIMDRFLSSFGERVRVFQVKSISHLPFSLESHKLFSRLSLEGRWISQDPMMRSLISFAYAVTS